MPFGQFGAVVKAIHTASRHITHKDRYPLPLIDETLARLAKAKVYIKLDIRQAFYRI